MSPRHSFCLLTCLSCLVMYGWMAFRFRNTSLRCLLTDCNSRYHHAMTMSSAKSISRTNYNSVERPSLSANSTQTGHRKQSGAKHSLAGESLVTKNSWSAPNHSAPHLNQNSATDADAIPAMRSLQDSASFAHHQNSDQYSPSVEQYHHSFEIREPFSLPMSNITVSIRKLLSTMWMKELKDILSKFPTKSCKPITILMSDHTYRAALVNWIIAATVVAQPPVSNVLVLCLDKYLYELLKSKRISCIHVDPTVIINPSFNFTRYKTPVTKAKAVTIRMTITRLLNHWGFNVILYDIDALIMRSPQRIYQQYSEADIIGSYGYAPRWIKNIWGFTVCSGVFWIRSSPQTGE